MFTRSLAEYLRTSFASETEARFSEEPVLRSFVSTAPDMINGGRYNNGFITESLAELGPPWRILARPRGPGHWPLNTNAQLARTAFTKSTRAPSNEES